MKLYPVDIKQLPNNPDFIVVTCIRHTNRGKITATILVNRITMPLLYNNLVGKDVGALEGKYFTIDEFIGVMKDTCGITEYIYTEIHKYKELEREKKQRELESIMGPDQIVIQQMNQTTDLEFDFNEFKVQPIIMPHTHVPSFKGQPVNHSIADCDGMCCADCTVSDCTVRRANNSYVH